jgi:serine/threonine protein phosphatase PrpC
VNQDALFVHQEPSYWLFGVCDGHGTNGHFISEFIK